jgi:hypothetical protein
MGERAHDTTPSLDDGIPYYPTLSAIAESPRVPGLLYVGTDDGNLQVSRDDGATWTNVAARLPGVPVSSWISGIEPSRFDDGTVYVVINNYRNDDFANYLFKSTDFGESWESIVGNLPANRVLRTIREDTRRPSVLFLGTELGLFYTFDGGAHWMELKSNMPTAAFNDLVIHPRDNDLVLGTHGRGIWILDNINALQELTPDVLAADAHLFTTEPARMIRLQRAAGHTGDMVFRGQNPPLGAVLDYYLRESVHSDEISLTIIDGSGSEVNTIRPTTRRGLNRVTWDLRYPNLGPVDPRTGQPRGPAGPWVLPGTYTARLTVGEQSYETAITVRDDPRIDVADGDRTAWHRAVVSLGMILQSYLATADRVLELDARVDSLPEADRAGRTDLVSELDKLVPLVTELRSRLQRLYGQVSDWPRPFTADEQSQQEYFEEWIQRLEPRMARVLDVTLPEVEP